ncbi:MAG: hypothetical protein IKO15_07190 [Clostridiales bacterium]|nr:hypothetical protein [Clostridiales bacterium]
MRKITAVILCIVLCMSLICACGRKTDSEGNTLITSKWECVSYTINGTYTDLRDDSIFIKLLMSKDNPKFTSDGETFTVTVLQKDHSGRLVQNEDGSFQMVSESGKSMKATIVGNTLTISAEGAGVEIVFETS